MSTVGDHRGIGDLLGDLTRDVSMLFRKEIELAKAETGEKVGKAMQGVSAIAIGGILGIGAIGVLLTAAVAGVAALLVAMGMGATGANALGALIVGIIVAVVAWTFVKQGIDRLKTENLWLDKTASSVSRDAAFIKEKVNGQL